MHLDWLGPPFLVESWHPEWAKQGEQPSIQSSVLLGCKCCRRSVSVFSMEEVHSSGNRLSLIPGKEEEAPSGTATSS